MCDVPGTGNEGGADAGRKTEDTPDRCMCGAPNEGEANEGGSGGVFGAAKEELSDDAAGGTTGEGSIDDSEIHAL